MMLKFWGTRGSVPVPGRNTLKYGGNTPCVELRSDKNKIVILDCGTGIRELGNSPGIKLQDEFSILLSHYHWDHIQGIPFFKPLYDKRNKITFYGQSSNDENVKALLNKQMTPNFFPISVDEFNAQLKFVDIQANKKFSIYDLRFETFRVVHSSPTLTFKISGKNKSVVYMTDNEINLDSPVNESSTLEFRKDNRELIEFCSGADYLIHDTMYEEESMGDKKGWGHSSNISLARFSIIAGIKNLILFHYNPDYTDERIDKLLADTENVLNENNSGINCIAAREGLELDVNRNVSSIS